jgi:hypothetical protein
MHLSTICCAIAVVLAGCAASPPSTGERVGSHEREALTREQCEARAGHVVGDIGDGATHRPDYTCPGGKPPLGDIVPPAGGPIAIEGSVCCPR